MISKIVIELYSFKKNSQKIKDGIFEKKKIATYHFSCNFEKIWKKQYCNALLTCLQSYKWAVYAVKLRTALRSYFPSTKNYLNTYLQNDMVDSYN